MLSMSVRTALPPMEVLDGAYRHFGERAGLQVVEIAAHLHAEEGFSEIRLSSGRLVGNGEYESRGVLQDIVKHLDAMYGLKIVYYLLHIHSLPDDSAEHLTVTVTTGSPTEVHLACTEHEQQVRAFASTLPKAA